MCTLFELGRDPDIYLDGPVLHPLSSSVHILLYNLIKDAFVQA